MKKSIAILTGGGPAPGMNTVIASITKIFYKHGYRVLGFHGGYSGLFTSEPRFEELNPRLAGDIFSRGGAYLRMSRYKPTDEDFEKRFNLDFFVDNNVQLLITIGGDDTASTANRISKFLEDRNYSIANLHVPKTIDNDLPLPNGVNTFGYHSALNSGTTTAKTVFNDAKTSENWFVLVAMGRSAGHLALGIGSSAHYPMIIIPEMFNKAEITLEKITNMIVSAIVKRRLRGLYFGSVIISEGVFHAIKEEEIENAGIVFTYDDHGHPELGKISKSQVFNILLENKLKELNLAIKTRPVEIGYEMRCMDPIAYDLNYCTALGYATHKLFVEGASRCMVFVDQAGSAYPLYLSDLQDKVTGKIPPRLVDVETDKNKLIFHDLLDYITEEDYEAAKEYLPNPEEYDFLKMLNWEE